MSKSRVYQSVGGDWIAFWNDSKDNRFPTEAEAYIFLGGKMEKLEFAKAVIALCKSVLPAMDDGLDLLREYFDNGPSFTDDDLASLGVTAAELASCITFVEQAAKFFTGDPLDPPANAAYHTTLNAIRRSGNV